MSMNGNLSNMKSNNNKKKKEQQQKKKKDRDEGSYEATIKLFDHLMKMEHHILRYSMEVSKFIEDDAFLQSQNITFFNYRSENIHEITNLVLLIAKYRNQITQLKSYEHIFRVFETIHILVAAQFTKIKLLAKTKDFSNGDSLVARLLLNVFILHHSIDLTVEKIIQQYYKLREIKHYLTKDTVDRSFEKFSNFCFPQAKDSIEYYKKIITKCSKQYSPNEEAQLFGLYLLKSTIHINIDQPKYENMKNSILQKILDNEEDTSSGSFTEQELVSIDLMEYLTAHIDFFPRVLLIFDKFQSVTCKCLQLHRQRLTGQDNENRDSSNDGTFVTTSDRFSLSKKLTPAINRAIDKYVKGGTIGLAKTECCRYTFRLLLFCGGQIAFEFKTIEANLILTTSSYEEKSFLLDILNTFQTYAESLSGFLTFLSEPLKGKGNAIAIMGTHRDEFEKLDELLKQLFLYVLECETSLDLEEEMISLKTSRLSR